MCDDLVVIPRSTSRRLLVPLVAVCLLLGVGCGGDDGSAPQPELSAAGEAGREVAQRNGCMSCHSVDGRDGVGPTWAGLAGSEVELEDGSVVLADEQYLTTAIVDPNAQIVKGYRGIMPERRLDPDDVAAIVTYLQELGSQ